MLTLILIVFILLSKVQSTLRLVCYSNTKLESHFIYSMFIGKKPGFFVDVGPMHPLLDSNSIYLSSQGWTGINLLASQDLYNQFEKCRKQQTNLYLKSLKQDFEIRANQTTLSDVCQMSYSQRPALLTSSLKYIKFIMSSNWQDKKCQPEVMIIRKKEDQQIDKEMLQKIEGFGYDELMRSQYFYAFGEKGMKMNNQLFLIEKGVKKQVKYIDLLSFNTIIKQLYSKIFNTVLNQKQIKSNIIQNKLKIIFTTHKSPIQIPQLIQQTPEIRNYLLMQVKLSSNLLLLPQSSFTLQYQTISDNQSYYLLKYTRQEGSLYYFYIFDYQDRLDDMGELGRLGRKRKYVVENVGLGMGLPEFDSEQIAKFDIEDVGRFVRSNKTEDEDIYKQNNKKQQDVDSQITKIKNDLIQSQQKLRQKIEQYENEKNKNKKTSQIIRTLQKQIEELSQKRSQTIKKQAQQTNTIGDAPKQNINTKKQTQTTNQIEQVFQKYVVYFLILLSAIIGSVLLTILVMRRKQNNGARIQNNSQIDMEVGAKAESDDVEDVGHIEKDC